MAGEEECTCAAHCPGDERSTMATETPTPVRPEGQLLTMDDLAEILRVTPSTIRRHRALGWPMPPAIRIGGKLRWRREDVEAFFDEQIAEAA